MTVRNTAFLLIAALLFCICGCTKDAGQSKGDGRTSTNIDTASSSPVATELSDEEESKIKLIIDFNGKWQKNNTVILIIGKTGKIIGKNGGEICITVRYLSEKRIKIIEGAYNQLYLENWFTPEIAKQACENANVRAFSILDIIDNNTLKGESYAWKLVHQSNVIMSVEPFKSYETWHRIK